MVLRQNGVNVVSDLLHFRHYEIDQTWCDYTHTHTHAPCLVIANMVDIGEVRNRISTGKILEAEISCSCRKKQ